ncbi:type II toxin-antitoxin system prevent-host-death family antitoxin [Cellulosimicrobium sp. Marseille-Q4280]|jgi:prevent-host-death family protein|uniref:type II toxin-antitoxin system Phd/YefM family antitoxin n=1 Tax=Cellulosimicrobium sp. Marseille-Q4280 TaxID=2937992 RepID=UPI00204111CC|nr:type II toxin-antitoxin system prevent-host-death family antitoxin [Cellulosimicrobium sp. Marseille-Q4280]
MQVNVLEAKNNLSALIARAAAGEEVVIAKRDVPLVRLVPVRADLSHGTGPAILEWLEAHPPRSVRSAEEVDADIAAEREGWE